MIRFPGVYASSMPTRLHLEPPLTTGELAQRYRRARDPVKRSLYHILWLLSQGHLTRDVVAASGDSAGWIQTIARRYNQQGPAGLGTGGMPTLARQSS